MNPNIDAVCSQAGRDAKALTRRDVARTLLSVPSAEALDALPGLRRELVAQSNPFSAAFWDATESVLGQIAAGTATVRDVRKWLEATGTEPIEMIGLYVWPDEDERGPLAREFHGLLVAHLEERLTAGDIDPDRLVSGDADALKSYETLQEKWLTSSLADGRVPMHAVMDEEDDEFFAAWDEQAAEALSELDRILDEVGERPRPDNELHAAAARVRKIVEDDGWKRDLLVACGGLDPADLPADDAELWLTVAAGVANPVGDLPEGDQAPDDENDELAEDDETLAALCAIDHVDWLAAVTALARKGPGTAATDHDIARLIGESEDVEGGYDDLYEEEATAAMFVHVVLLWEVLGALDEHERLTPLGWWGLPEALRRAWQPREDATS